AKATSDSKTPVVSSTGVKCSTICGSKPPGNKKNDRISQTHQHSLSNANSDIICATCNKSMFDGVHDKFLLDLVQNGNKRSSKVAKIVESKNANHSEPNQVWGSNATDIPSSSSLIMTCCPDCTLVSGLRMFETHDREMLSAHELWLDHNLFSVGQFCDTDLEVAFQKNTCFIRNLYTISLDDMLKSSPICLLSKASKTKSWLWLRRLSHLNLGTLNKLAKDRLARGIPRLKF
ncbi:retrovirus-related pol polyprotein from transposon TNT 1-94, partial [Tanacetum coccineum]